MIEYEIIRSGRKTLAIYITKDGQVKVRCNYKEKESKIKEFVNIKENWITKHLNNISKQPVTPLRSGSPVLYLGKEYEIVTTKDIFRFDKNNFYINGNADIYKELEAFYKERAKAVLPDMVHKKEEIMKLYASDIKITSAATRWGSCSAKNNLNFPWMLMMADPEVINYVIVHELAHIKEKNHGKNFWAVVGKYQPDYKDRKEQLRILERRIQRECWNRKS